MKKIIKNKNLLRYSFGFIIGAILFGSARVLASSYILKSSDIEYKANKSVQEAVEELYTLVDNGGGSNQTLPIGEISVKSLTVKIPYTGTYKDIKCLYGTNENYGSRGTISNNTCIFMGTAGNQKLYYKLIATNDDGKIYEKSGNVTTGTETNIIVTDIPQGTKAIIYLDPTDLTKTCNETNSTSTTGTKSGCMKWYAYDENSASYTMILDHNTTAKVNSWSEAKTQLATDTAGWAGYSRLITGEEIANITGITWTLSGSRKFFSADYYWLYDYINNCKSAGCKVADSSTEGYWTSDNFKDEEGDDMVWSVSIQSHRVLNYTFYDAYLGSSGVDSTGFGVRPVITILKSNL